MSRNKGTFNYSANFEPLLKAPMDARGLVDTYSDLTSASTWEDFENNIWLFNGLTVSVANDPTIQNNGLYFLCDADNYNNTCSWIKLSTSGATGGGTITGATNGLSISSGDVILGGVLSTSTTIADSRGTPLGIEYGGDYSATFSDRSLVDKGYVDTVAVGLQPKSAAKVGTITGITLSGLSTIDGVSLSNGDRVLVKDQINEIDNGIYIASASTWSRSTDFDGTPQGEVSQGALVPIISGNTQSNSLWILTTPDPITIGVTPLTFSQFTSPVSLIPGVGIIISGTTISVDGASLTGDSIAWTGDTFNVDLNSGSLGSKIDSIEEITSIAITGGTNGLTKNGRNLELGGTLSNDTFINANSNLFFVNNICGMAIQGTCGTVTTSITALSSLSGISLSTSNSADGTCHRIRLCDSISIQYCDSSNDIGAICIRDTGMFVTDNVNDRGFIYQDDYSANYTCRSLPDVEYVNSLVTGLTSQGITGATNGLTKSGDTVVLGGALTGNTEIDLDDNYFKIFNDDTGFNVGSGFNNKIESIEVQTDDKILVGGWFTTFNGNSRNYIVRLNSDGSIDNTFIIGSGFSSIVTDIEIQNDGKILAGGYFTTYSGVTANRIIRLNSDGSIDNTFDTGTGFGGIIHNLEIQDDGKILVGGAFTTYSGQTANRIIRLNSDGSIDNTFSGGTGFNNNVFDIEVQDDGNILVGGEFTTYSGVTANRIIRLDSGGTIDNTFSGGTAFNARVRDIEIQDDNKLIVVGAFTTYSGVTNNYVIRLNSDGSIDNTFDAGTGFNGTADVVNIQTDGKFVIGGFFSTFTGTSQNYITRLNSDGSRDTGFSVGTGLSGGSITSVLDHKILSNGKILIGGDFTSYNGTSSNYIAQLKSTGEIDSTGIAISVIFNSVGAEFGGDYSNNYTARSIPDVAFVTGQTTPQAVTGATNGLSLIDKNVVLGGLLDENTFICGDDTYNVAFGTAGSRINAFSVTTCGTVGFNSLNGIDIFGQDRLILSSTSGTLLISGGSTIFNDNSGSPAGIEYDSNYCSTFTNRSLVDKEYVDQTVTGNSNTVNVCNPITTGYTATTASEFIGALSGSTIYLPPSPKDGQRISIADVTGNALACNIIICGSGLSINGDPTATINTDYGSITVINNGSFWSGVSFIN